MSVFGIIGNWFYKSVLPEIRRLWVRFPSGAQKHFSEFAIKLEQQTIFLLFTKLQVILHTYISNSLIIHNIKTKEINTETEFGYVMKHLHKIKPIFISIFPLNTNLFEMLYQTLFLVFDLLHIGFISLTITITNNVC